MKIATMLLPLVGVWPLASVPAPTAPAAVSQEAPEGFALDGDARAGKKVYAQYCQKCHGKKGNGSGMMAKDLDPKPRDFTDAARMGQRSDWQIYLGIKEGGSAVGLSEQMTAWKDSLTDREMRDVAAYIREFAR